MPASHPLHVVVIDDSPLYADIYRGLFAIEGYRVTTLTDCAVAPAQALGLAPDLVVLDLRCGTGLAGLDFLRRLREDPEGRAVPVVASTPASLIDMDRFGDELRALGVPIFDGLSQYDDLLAAARDATSEGRRATSRALGDCPASSPGR